MAGMMWKMTATLERGGEGGSIVGTCRMHSTPSGLALVLAGAGTCGACMSSIETWLDRGGREGRSTTACRGKGSGREVLRPYLDQGREELFLLPSSRGVQRRGRGCSGKEEGVVWYKMEGQRLAARASCLINRRERSKVDVA